MSISKLLETQFIDISGSQNKTHNFYWGIISKPSENNSRKPQPLTILWILKAMGQ